MKKIKIKLESLNSKILSLYIKFLLKVLVLGNVKTQITYLPNVTKRITFLKSPHVFKKAKEHFQLTKNSVSLACNANLQDLKPFLLNRPNTIKIKIVYEKRG
jgi:ribosomal protein S10